MTISDIPITSSANALPDIVAMTSVGQDKSSVTSGMANSRLKPLRSTSNHPNNHGCGDDQELPVVGVQPTTSHKGSAHHAPFAGGSTSETPTFASKTQSTNGVSDQTTTHQNGIESHARGVGGSTSANQGTYEAQIGFVGGSTSPDHTSSDHRSGAVGGSATQTNQVCRANHFGTVGLDPILADPLLGVAAETVDDLENTRKAAENRLRSLTAVDVYNLPDDHPSVQQAQAVVDAITQAEKQAVATLEKLMKQHPLGPWIKSINGVGYKTIARLLAAVGDPYWHYPQNRPRRLSELRAYCGMDIRDGYAPAYRKGTQANWNAVARMRLWNIAQPCIRGKGKYRTVYDDARTKYADATHVHECKRCGPTGKPAQPGSPLSDGHKHARATRMIMRAVLKDLWTEAKRIHEQHQDIRA